MGQGVLHDLGNILPAVLEDQVSPTRMLIEEVGHIVHIGADCDVARFRGVMRGDIGDRKGRKALTGHCEVDNE